MVFYSFCVQRIILDLPNLGQSVPSIAGLLCRVLFFDDVSSRGHSAIQQGFLYVFFFGGQQFPDHRHQLYVLYQSYITVHPERQVALEEESERTAYSFVHDMLVKREVQQ